MAERIGLIGIGLVGTALAENLLGSGFGVVGYDPIAEKREALIRLGGEAAENPRIVGSECRRTLISVLDTDVVYEVVKGRQGLLESRPLPEYIIDTTTGDPDRTAALAVELDKAGICFLDSTISGSSQQIRERLGVFMVGGDSNAFSCCEGLFKALAEKVYYLGPSGSGSKAKLANNLILGLNRLVLAEGLVFAERLGLDPRIFLEMSKVSPAYSCAMDVKGEKMIQGDFTPQSRIRQHHKDLKIMLEYARQLNQSLPLAEAHERILSSAITDGRSDLDTSAVILQIREMKNESLPPKIDGTVG
jgi:3-hydroxyisobutyrate dehydrogenase-like beta-hydroxyacid dehydrogenase